MTMLRRGQGWLNIVSKVLAAGIALGGVGAVQAQVTTFTYNGGVQTYTVPTGAVGVVIEARGAGGGGAGSDGQAGTDGGAGGAGALATGTYPVGAGTILNVHVGGRGGSGQTGQGGNSCASTAGSAGVAGGTVAYAGAAGSPSGCNGFSGGGGGGGAGSGVSTQSNQTILIAGGGGGGQGGSLRASNAPNGNGVAGGSSSATSNTVNPTAGSAPQAPGNDGGGGGGGGGGCPGGVGGRFKPDGQLPNPNTPAGGGSSCRLAAVVPFNVTAGGGGAGGTGALSFNYSRNVANGATDGQNGQVIITPIFPSLSVVKAVGTSPWFLDNNGQYNLTVTNTAAVVANSATVQDQLPPGMAYINNFGSDAGWSCTPTTPDASGILVTCTFASTIAASGGTSLLRINARPDTSSTKINRASIDPTGGISPPAARNCTAAGIPSPGCAAPVSTTFIELTISKSQPSPALQVGSNSTYTITANNFGSTTATTARFQDQLPASLSFVSAAGANWTCSAAASGSETLVTCDFIGSVAAGANLPLVSLVVSPTTNQQVTNYTAIAPRGGTTVPVSTTCTAAGAPTRGCGAPVVSTPVSPVLSVVKSQPSPVLSLDTASAYTLTVTNSSSATAAATSAQVLDQLPSGMTYNSSSGTGWSCTPGTPDANGTLVTCNFSGTIAVNGTSVLTINATPTTSSSKTNRASIDPSGGSAPPTALTCTAPNNPTAGCAAPVVSTLTELAISKTQPSPALQVGNNSTYTITASNTGSAAVTTARFQDQLPASLTFVNAIGTGWTCSQIASGGGTLVTCSYSGTSIAAGANFPAVALTVTPTTNQQVTNFVAIDSRGGTVVPAPNICTAFNAPTRGCGAPVVSNAGLAVSGRVYLDANANNSIDGTESGTGVANLFVKLTPSSGTVCSGPATAAASVNTTTGAFSLSNVAQGNYCLILDNNATLSDIAPVVPSGYIGTENASGIVQITVSAAPEPPQNFGLYNGSQLSGVVFLDTGIGAGGVANNGIRDGAEADLGGVLVEVRNGAVVVASTTTAGNGAYTVFVPGPVGTRVVTPVLPSGYLATGGTAGNTGGTYTRPSLSYTTVLGASRTNANFGAIAPNNFLANGAQSTAPGSVVFYTHTYTPGSAGNVTFGLSALATPVLAGWTQVLYRDTNCSAVFDPSEPQITAAIAATGGTPICIIVRQQAPAGAPLGAQNTITVSATMDYVNDAPALAPPVLVLTDTTTIGQGSSLVLAKLVRNITVNGPGVGTTAVNAAPGSTLEYTITATNNGSQNATTLVINDATPTFTNFVSAQCVTPLPAGITACTVNIQPAVAAAGAVQWTLAGSLMPSVQVAVRFQVRVDQ